MTQVNTTETARSRPCSTARPSDTEYEATGAFDPSVLAPLRVAVPDCLRGAHRATAQPDLPVRLRDLPPQQIATLGHGLQKLLRARGHSREDAEDLAQEALLKGLTAVVRSSLRALLRSAASNAGSNLRRQRQRDERRLGKRSGLDPVLLPCDPWADREAGELREALPAALEQLPDLLCRLVQMRLDGRTFAVIGEMLGLDEKQASRYYRRALIRLRHLLRDFASD